MRNDLVKLGSQIARNGFKNEQDICDKFINYNNDKEAKYWLKIMGYDLDEIEYVRAVVLHGYKADVNVQVQIKLKDALDTENIQVKLVSNKRGFNQIDKRWLKNYKELWNIPENVYMVLQYYSEGDVLATRRGSIKIGKITIQRKGGDAGRETANMLQFKLNPAELFDI